MNSEDKIHQELDTEAKILLAAEKEFMLKGFAGARTTSIAEAAGVTHAMFHYYFRTKEKLFDRIITEKIELLKDALMKPVADMDLTLDEMIRNIIEGHLDFIAANPDLPRFIIGELSGNSERFALFLDKISTYAQIMISRMQEKIDSAVAEGLCCHIDARTLMMDIASLNIFPYLAAPIVNAALDNYMADADTFLEQRKKDNYATIMRKLKP
ncbi:MAG: TetR/AcrR family transcriptional regulator [Muribaculaceae bacterium]|nr:TetR/AcrR family transcriptional regulator [Muribaculaceae bacterium]